ncbi:PqqD family peptide modification chaperone [Halomonas daqiaonensis]|uniref:Coenzyme PQQ synthesis protein D (PqqD) n=1 Tax=Halomonas daqiaonensis TaxID=650850 RepID=A0A1H7HLC4_9GAMM|nr:PqqD family peptide modification chaperone [Halomonas daqiaonensis]SEK48995.1 Coenzyme PQQ synthesis protein D (PqqD) [Halomonas daqiaonensis]
MIAANLVVTLYDGTRVPAARLLSATGQPDITSALEELATAIRANPLWSRLTGSALIGRYEPAPLLAVVGTFTEEQQALLMQLRDQLDLLMQEREFVDYPHAEAVCGRLAERLVATFSAEFLKSAQFAAIPRGGLIVLGMLAYHLDLRPEQLTTLDAAAVEKTLFVVDDCSLSGTRFRESLSLTAADDVVFCPLYAPEALCAGIVSCEPRVVACLSGATLEDTTPAPGGAGHEAWRRQRLARLGDDCYWPGQTLGVAFAWCTPRTRRWDETAGRFVEGWDVVPPSRCLKRRLLLRRLENDAIVDYLPTLTLNIPYPGADIRAHDRVLWCCKDDGVIVARIPQRAADSASVYRLDGISAKFWQLLMIQGSMQRALAALLGRYQVSRERLEADMDALVEQMRAEGLLVCNDQLPQDHDTDA